MMAENCWERYLRLLCENPEIKDSPPYNFIVMNYPIPLMAKLLSIALNGSSAAARNNAATEIQEIIEHDLLKNAYLNIHLSTLDLFRRSAIHLMVSNPADSDLQDCGLFLAVKLVRLSLEHNDIDGWDEFLELTERGFSTRPQILGLILHIFCELSVEHMDKLVSFLEPCLRRNAAQFITTLRNLLEQGNDYRVYMILPAIFRFISEGTWKTLMEGAIMSPFFRTEPAILKRVCGAVHLKVSIEMTSFNFSSALIPSMREHYLMNGFPSNCRR